MLFLFNQLKQLKMVQKKVTIQADELGNVICQTSNPEIGYVRVSQESHSISDTGWVKIENRSALILGTLTDLMKFNFKASQQLEGKIIVEESFMPFNLSNPDRDLKMAGNTDIVCRVGDQPIYRRTKYTMDLNAIDELKKHTNSDEIKESFVSVNNPKKIKATVL